MRDWVKKEDVDELQFRDEIQHYLAELRSCGSEGEALRRTKANYPRLRDSDIQSWPQDEAYRMARQEALALGAEARAYEERQAEAQRRAGDPFSMIPDRGAPTEPDAPGWLQRWTQRGLDVLDSKRDSQASNFTPLRTKRQRCRRTVGAARTLHPTPQTLSLLRRGPRRRSNKSARLPTEATCPTLIADGTELDAHHSQPQEGRKMDLMKLYDALPAAFPDEAALDLWLRNSYRFPRTTSRV